MSAKLTIKRFDITLLLKSYHTSKLLEIAHSGAIILSASISFFLLTNFFQHIFMLVEYSSKAWFRSYSLYSFLNSVFSTFHPTLITKSYHKNNTFLTSTVFHKTLIEWLPFLLPLLLWLDFIIYFINILLSWHLFFSQESFKSSLYNLGASICGANLVSFQGMTI